MEIKEVVCLNEISEKQRGHPGLNQGPLDLQSNALPLSYIPNDNCYCLYFLYSSISGDVKRLVSDVKSVVICLMGEMDC